MTVFTYSEARQKLAEVLRRAQREGAVQIRRRDGTTFTLRPTTQSGSPLDVEGGNRGLRASEIVDCVRGGRQGYKKDD